MPSKRRSQKPNDLSELAKQANEVYERFLAFLRLASGFTLAVAVCDLPILRNELIARATSDAKKFGLAVQSVDISKVYERDFVAAVDSQMTHAPEGASRTAVLVTGIDPLIYRPDEGGEQEAEEGRPPFVARLNFDRERISQQLPFPIVLWLEKEAFSLLLREAPDLTQWISARFDFGGVSPRGLHFFETLLLADRVMPGESHPVGSSNEKSLLDELEKIPRNGDQAQLSQRAMIMALLAQHYLLSSEESKGDKHAREALSIAKQLGNKRLESQLHVVCGSILLSLGKTKQAIQELELALGSAKETQDPLLLSRALLSLGQAHLKAQAYSPASSYLAQSFAAALSSKNKTAMLAALTELGSVYSSTHEFAKAIETLEQAIKLAKEAGELRQEAKVLIQTGDLLELEDDGQKAIEYYERSLQIVSRLNDAQLQAQCLNRIALAYSKLHEFRRAIPYWDKALTVAARSGQKTLELGSLNGLGLTYLSVGNTAAARKYLDRALSEARTAGHALSEALALGYLSLMLSDEGEKEKGGKLAARAIRIVRRAAKEQPEAKEVLEFLEFLRDDKSDATALRAAPSARGDRPIARDSRQ